MTKNFLLQTGDFSLPIGGEFILHLTLYLHSFLKFDILKYPL